MSRSAGTGGQWFFGDEDSRAQLCDVENVVYNITNSCTFLNCQ